MTDEMRWNFELKRVSSMRSDMVLQVENNKDEGFVCLPSAAKIVDEGCGLWDWT
jgi:hypothetical protein